MQIQSIVDLRSTTHKSQFPKVCGNENRPGICDHPGDGVGGSLIVGMQNKWFQLEGVARKQSYVCTFAVLRLKEATPLIPPWVLHPTPCTAKVLSRGHG